MRGQYPEIAIADITINNQANAAQVQYLVHKTGTMRIPAQNRPAAESFGSPSFP
jgi:hypothetical protein